MIRVGDQVEITEKGRQELIFPLQWSESFTVIGIAEKRPDLEGRYADLLLIKDKNGIKNMISAYWVDPIGADELFLEEQKWRAYFANEN